MPLSNQYRGVPLARGCRRRVQRSRAERRPGRGRWISQGLIGGSRGRAGCCFGLGTRFQVDFRMTIVMTRIPTLDTIFPCLNIMFLNKLGAGSPAGLVLFHLRFGSVSMADCGCLERTINVASSNSRELRDGSSRQRSEMARAVRTRCERSVDASTRALLK